MELYEHLRKLRKEAGYSQESLAEELGISRQAVSKWESGAASPDINHLIRLGELYHVSTDYILFGDIPQADETELSVSNTLDISKEKPAQKQPVNGVIWVGLGVLAILILYYATNGF